MIIRFGQIELDEQRLLLQRAGVRLQIRPKVFDLLVYLVRYRERVVLRDELIMALWGTTVVGLGSLSGLVNELRQILGEAGQGPSSIRTVHARGYQFVGEIDARKIGENPLPEVETEMGRIGRPRRSVARGLGRFDEARSMIRASLARVSTAGARAVILVGQPDACRSSLLEHASADIAQAGFEIHDLRVETGSERQPVVLVDRLIETLVERYGTEAIRSLIPVRASELRERVAITGSVSNLRAYDPLASRQYDERIWRSAAELLAELAHRKPLALVLDDPGHSATTAPPILSQLLHLLGEARVFLLVAASVAGADASTSAENTEPRIEYVKIPATNRDQLNELFEARGIAALPVVLVDALLAHVRNDEASLELVARWLQAQGAREHRVLGESGLPSPDRRMKRVEPDTTSRRSGFGTA